ncbi:hypothetical protein BX616_003311 [Lobosporangium transversale]|nr:hypothetical protein BX616_003311 [Lobosporangium transversale]
MKMGDILHVNRSRHYSRSPVALGSYTLPKPKFDVAESVEEHEAVAALDSRKLK